ncbi:MAG: energy transducer TonB, partial [Methylotenera sp.]|nr:energy transducer TonB [Methylotenera sp.]
IAPPPPFIPPPEVVVATPPPTETIQVTTAVVPQVVERMVPTAPPDPASTAPVNTPRAAEPVKEPTRVAAERDKSSCEDPEYPPTSRRNEEQGTVILRFLVDVSGHVVDGKVATSSGSSRLDRAAKDAFSQCTFKPATVDGKPEQAWVSVRYLFQLN